MSEKKIPVEDAQKIKKLEKQVAQSRRSLEELRHEKLFSEKVLDSLPGIFYLYNESGDILRWNKNHETLTGFSSEELRHRKILEWFDGADKEYIAARIHEVFNKGKTLAEAHLIIKSGERIPYYFTGMRMIANGRKYLLGMGLDISELKKAEQALRESEEKYRQIFENAVEGIFQSTPDGRFISANPSMASILGYDSAEELMFRVTDIGKQLYVSEDTRNEFIALMRTQKVVSGFEVQFFRKDGSQIWASLQARPVADEKGELVMIEGIFSDITQRKEVTDALIEREEYLSRENLLLKSNFKDRYRFGAIVGKSPAMQEVYELILRAAATDANVIVYGESGTGKELVAKAIHDLSDRKTGDFVTVNCSAIPESLLESEFFGYKKGAFTGAGADKEGYLDLADRGSLFLDELGEINPNMQAKLLRVLEGGGFIPVGGHRLKKPDIRIIGATNKDLSDLVKKGAMREDFFYRIHIIPIHLPPLRDRKEDLPLLIENFMETHRLDKKRPPLRGDVLEALLRHEWPGNVRELQNVLQRYFTMNTFDLLQAPGRRLPEPGPAFDAATNGEKEEYNTALAHFERKLIESALERNRWHREKAAASLALPRRTFFRKMKKYGLIRHELSQ
jgi:PAS domain S-box-containing protein